MIISRHVTVNSDKMENCANCNAEFARKADNKGWHRFSIDNKLPGCDKIAKDVLVQMTGSKLTPTSKKFQGRYLCPPCWQKLNGSAKYHDSLQEFWGRSSSASYLGGKRKKGEDLSFNIPSSKKPRYTSTPKVFKTPCPPPPPTYCKNLHQMDCTRFLISYVTFIHILIRFHLCNIEGRLSHQ